MDKDCNNCGARLASHTARRRVVRMPRPVQAPETLSLSAFALDEVAPAGYRLTAIVRHIGASLEAGHFVADARRPSRAGGEEWVRYDDARVGGIGRGVPLEASETAYVAFYVHEGVEG